MASASSSRLYPEIISDEQRRRYKSEFDSDLTRYKALCAEMDQLSDRIHQLTRELDGLDAESVQYQVKESSQLDFLFVFVTHNHVYFHLSGSGGRVQQTQRPEEGEWFCPHEI